MIVGLKLQADGDSDAFVSAGNTGAQMAASMVVLKLHAGLKRPAIATVFPTARKPVVVLDSGANVDCGAEELVQFARLGVVYAEDLLGRANPAVGLLSIGEEPEKGNAVVKEAHQLLQSAGLNFVGNVEGRDLPTGQCDRGPIDVVVCDGFVGNVVLKFYEAISPFIIGLLAKSGIDQKTMMDALKQLDYSEHGGAPLLGVNGVSIISHGKSSPRAIKNAIKVAVQAVDTKMDEHIGRRLGERVGERMKRPIAYFAGTGRGPVDPIHEFRLRESRNRYDRRVDRRANGHQAAPHRENRDRRLISPPAPRMQAMDRAGVQPGELDIIVLGTASPDRLLPSAAVDLQAALGASRAAAFDIGAACSGFIYSATVAESMIAMRRTRTRRSSWASKSSARSPTGRTARRACCSATARAPRCSSASKQQQGNPLDVPAQRRNARRSALPARRRRRQCRSARTCSPSARSYIKMNGREVFKNAVRSMSEAATRALDRRQAHRRGHRPADSAPGQHPHHRSDRQAREHLRWTRST